MTFSAAPNVVAVVVVVVVVVVVAVVVVVVACSEDPMKPFLLQRALQLALHLIIFPESPFFLPEMAMKCN